MELVTVEAPAEPATQRELEAGKGAHDDGAAVLGMAVSIHLSANGVYSPPMAVIETPTFTRQVRELFSDEDYRGLQNTLADDPECGDLNKGVGGIRKVRHAAQGRGKSGGVRAILRELVKAL
jgi:hypothetical protein